jgi:SAM-dependent methyltransferase
VQAVRKTLPEKSVNIMDVGPSFFTEILQLNLPDDKIYTLGFDHPDSRGGHFPAFIEIDKSKFYAFDLNNAAFRDKWISPKNIDIVVMGEVLEHLYTSPVHIFRFLKSMLAPGGYIVLGTPNAVSVQRRLAMFLGRNPYELIRETRDNPGHFREYTVPELKQLGTEAGLEFVDAELKNYFKRFTAKGRIFDTVVAGLFPRSFRSGINIVFKNPD